MGTQIKDGELFTLHAEGNDPSTGFAAVTLEGVTYYAVGTSDGIEWRPIGGGKPMNFELEEVSNG